MSYAILEITDGTTTVDLLREFHLSEWMMGLPQAKSGGYYQDSPLSDGRRLVGRVLGNVEEAMRLTVRGKSHDTAAYYLQKLLGLLEQAVEYWLPGSAAASPVYLVARSATETNIRYSVIYNYSLPDARGTMTDQAVTQILLDGLMLGLERGHWLANTPGTDVAAAIRSYITDAGARNFGDTDTSSLDVPVISACFTTSLTHVYIDDGGVFGANKIGSAKPYALLPAAPAVNDAVYFGIQVAANTRLFSALVFNLSTAQGANLVLTWEYWDGSAWNACTPSSDLSATGRRYLTFSDGGYPISRVMTAATVNAISAYWLRARVTGTGATNTPPAQDAYEPFTPALNYVEVQAASIKGDLPALARIAISDYRDGSGNDIFIGSRSMDRGADFEAWINLGDRDVPAGVAISGLTNVANANHAYSPTGRCIQRASGTASTGTFVLTMNNAAQWYGRYRVFIHTYNTGGAGGTVTITAAGASSTVLTKVLAVGAYDGVITDMGTLDIQEIAPGETPYLALTFSIAADNATQFNIFAVVLMPVDEQAFLITGNAASGATSRYQIDSTRELRRQLSAVHIYNSTARAVKCLLNGPAQLKAGERQRIYFLAYSSGTFSRVMEQMLGVRLYTLERFLSLRGNQ